MSEKIGSSSSGGGGGGGDDTSTTHATADVSSSCPYLDTINRTLLDFDFEPSCSITLESGPHVYGCMVCGKFFRGRGRSTPAYTHSVDTGHAVYVHLTRGTFHCLPDDYEVRDPSLADISAALHPTYTAADIAALDGNAALARDLFGRRYLPGFVGLNNLNKTDYINAVVQALAHVRPLRDYFLRLGGSDSLSSSGSATGGGAAVAQMKRKRSDKSSSSVGGTDPTLHSDLAQCFGDLIRKMWSDKRFKSTVDPHMFVQAVSVASRKRYHIGKQAEAGEFLAWLLHQLHVGLGGGRKAGSSIIHKVFQGTVEVTTRQRKKGSDDSQHDDNEEEDDRAGSDDEDTIKAKEEERERKKAEVVIEEKTTETHFLQLTLDIPEKPLFKDADGGLVIPQEPLVSVLRKFDGTSFSDAIGRGGVAQKRRYRLRKLPNYLVLHLTRFKRNEFTVEKNPTIVSFPIKNLDLSPYVMLPEGEKKRVPPTEEEVRAMSVKELKKLLAKHGRADVAESSVEKAELVTACVDFVTNSLPDMLADKYDLVANVTHHIPAEVGREEQRDLLQEGSYHCHVQHKGTGQWYDIQDLHVEETMPQLIGISESYVLIFEKKGLS
mmetsp:Transcript_3264/g.7087  ORF Transcript_3264/g.7087 Transcript_3264/m.7087 type:complete len:606 (+) Transcript_3264:103-1920(+)